MNWHKTIYSAFALALTSSCGPLPDQPAAQQTAADTLHQEIMARTRSYRHESGVKVMAGCLAWQDRNAVRVSGLNWYYFPTRYAMLNRPVNRLRTRALGECEGLADTETPKCTCQIIDVNGRNAIVAPDTVATTPLEVEFRRSPPRPPKVPPVREPAPDSSLERLKNRAGSAAKSQG